MRRLVGELVTGKISRRGFVAGMLAAGYTASAAKSVAQSVAPQAAKGKELTRVMKATGGELLAEQISETGAKYIFVSNGSGLGPLCDAMVARPHMQLIQATHEGQVVAQAAGYAMASGNPGFCMHSRVGLPHSTSNMYNAHKDRTPLVIMSDHADSDREGTDSHEDVDSWIEAVAQYTRLRWVVEQPDRIPEWVRNCYKMATTMPGGPTAMRIPRDLLYKENVTAPIYSKEAFNIPMELRPNAKEVERVARLLIESTSPMLLVGPEVTQCKAEKPLIELAELLAIPVTQARSFHADFPNFHPLHVGELNRRMRYPKEIDLLFNFGARSPFGGGMAQRATLIQASVDPAAIGRQTPLRGALVGDLKQVAQDLVEAVKSLATKQDLEKRSATRRAECTAFTDKMRKAQFAAARRATGSPVPWQRMMVEFADQLEKDAIIVDEVGTETKVLTYFSYAENGGMLKIGRTEGRALGWGVGASAGVKLAHPNRQVVSFQGDGGFLFGQSDSLWTLSKYDIPVLTVILDNRTYEETRWQIMGHMGPAGQNNRDYISQLTRPVVAYTKLAEAYGIKGELVENSEDLKPAIARALKTLKDGRPYLLDVHLKTFGVGAENPWQPTFSLASTRTRNV
jgi:thiamine pyrophosphate-dependent acetolactate synthase large subunit-like protein